MVCSISILTSRFQGGTIFYEIIFYSNSRLVHLKKRNSSLHKSSNYSATKTIWQWAYASLVITCIFGQLSNVALASNDGLSKGNVSTITLLH